MEIVPDNVSEKDLQEELNRRTAKVGYTNRQGEPTYRTKIMAQGIGESKIKNWPRDKNGNLIDD